MIDSMSKAMTTKIGTCRWPLALFFNLLDLAAINAWIIFKKKMGSKISRRSFLLKLGEQLTDACVLSRETASKHSLQQAKASVEGGTRVNCRVRVNCDRNRTTVICQSCEKPMCGQCQAKVCVQCYQH